MMSGKQQLVLFEDPKICLKGVIRTPSGIILIQRSNLCSIDQDTWEFPGGKFEGGALKNELSRELIEELGPAIRGVAIGGLQLIFSHVETGQNSHNNGKKLVYLYILCTKNNFDPKKIILDPNEHQGQPIYVNPNTNLANHKLRPYTQRVLDIVFRNHWPK